MRTSKLSNINPLKLYWIFPIVVLLYGLLGKPETPGFVWWALLAAIACSLPLMATRYDPLSFVSIWALIHVLYYPVAVLLNLWASEPGVTESYLWEATPLAMMAMTVGMAGFALGSKITDIIEPISSSRRQINPDTALAEQEILAVSPMRNLCLVALTIPLALFALQTNTYYQILAAGAAGWSEESALSFGYVGYLEYIVCAGILLQLRRYFITRSRRDLIFAIAAFLLPILAFLPSGSRDRTLRDSLYPLLVALLGFQSRFSKRFFIYTAGVIMGILIFMITIETYRGTIYFQMKSVTITERSEILLNATKDSLRALKDNFDFVLWQWSRRFADYVMVGQIVSVFPTDYKYRGLEGIEYWPLFLLPNQLRPTTPYDPRDSATLSESVKIGFWSGSSPAMIIGDLYSRFSWLGVLCGMALIGSVLRFLDNRLRRFGLFETLLYGILLVPALKLPHESLLSFFLFLTRNMLLALLLATLVKKFLGRTRTTKSFRHPEVLKKMPGG